MNQSRKYCSHARLCDSLLGEMEVIEYSKKQFVLSLIVVSSVLLISITTVVMTSIVWVPLFILSSPLLFVVAVLAKYTSVRCEGDCRTY